MNERKPALPYIILTENQHVQTFWGLQQLLMTYADDPAESHMNHFC